ncbi:MAG: FtsQ-type POTRA domain-containing protein [Ruminococcaceae bacterium]|nr:FtsQ-type POTRA domain-containing protein [Oscillospiraceae bacterium]
MNHEVTDRPAGRRPEGASRGGTSAPTRRRSGQKKPPAPRKKVAAKGKKPLQKKRKKTKARRKVAFGKIFGRKFVRSFVLSLLAGVLLVLSLMAFLRVRDVSVVGNSLYSANEIREAAGVSEGSALLLVNKTAVAGRIKAQLPYIDDVRVGVSMPDTVKVEVVELESVYAVAADDGSYWLINSGGRLVEQITAKEASEYLTITGVRIENAVAGEDVQAMETPEPENPEGEESEEQTDGEAEMETPPEASAAQRMSTALQIVQQLEASDDIRSITTVDVTSNYDIQIWYGTQYQVKLGDTSELSYKLEYMLAAISKLDSYQSGVLDLTFEEAKKATFIPWTN